MQWAVRSNGHISEHKASKLCGKNSNAYHRATQKLDPRGNPVEFATFGLDGKPIEVIELGYRSPVREVGPALRCEQ